MDSNFNFLTLLDQQDVTAKVCGFSCYSSIKLLDFVKFDDYANLCHLAMIIGFREKCLTSKFIIL